MATTTKRGPGRTVMGSEIMRLLKLRKTPRVIAAELGCTTSAVRYYRKFLRGAKRKKKKK